MRWWRKETLVAIAIYALAVAARLTLLHVRPYGDEAHHYFVAREFGEAPDNLVGATDIQWLFWWRPLFSLFLVPGAQLSFTAFRVDYILLASILAPAGYLLLRWRGSGHLAAGAAGIVLAVHPFFVIWGVRAFPDELMAAFYVLGLALWQKERHVAGSVTLLVAIWVKEVALIGVLVLLTEEVWRSRRGWRPTPTRPAFLLAGVLALAWLPHLYAEHLGGRAPGWSRGGSLELVLDGVFLSFLVIPFVLAALTSPRGRRPALHALAYLAFYVAYLIVLGGAAEQWYFVLPSALATMAIAAALGDWANGAALTNRSLTGRALPIAAICALMFIQVYAPGHSPSKEAIHVDGAPLDFSAREAWDFERSRDQGMWQAIAAMTEEDRQGVFLVDVAWFFHLWPFSDVAVEVGGGFTPGNPVPARDWAYVIETLANSTVVFKQDTPMNHAIRETYADCVSYDNPDFAVIRAMGCQGRAEALQAAADAHAT